MSSDLDDLLVELGKAWDAAAAPIDLDEVVTGTPSALRVTPPDGRRRSWLVAGAAAAVAATIVAIALVDRPDSDAPTVTVPPTPPSATTVPDTTDATSTTLPPDTTTGVGAWWPVGPLPGACICGDFAILDDGRAVMTGASTDDGFAILVYDPATAAFDIGARLPSGEPRMLAPLADGRILLTGLNGEVFRYDPDSGAVDVLREQSQQGGGGSIAHQLPDGEVLLFGARTVQSLDPVSGAISDRPGGTTSTPRAAEPTIVLPLPDGTLLVADHLGAERFDPATGEFSPFDERGLGISWAWPLDDGRLLLVRTDPEYTLRSTELWNPATGESTRLGSWLPAAVLSDGRVLELDTGEGPGSAVTGAIHDLTDGTVEPIVPPTGQRFRSLAVPLDGGRVLLVGNYPGNGGFGFDVDTSTAELFAIGDPGLPAGCCAPNPTQVHVSATWVAEGTPAPTATLPARLTVPPGALAGATRLTWVGSEEHTSPSEGNVGGGAGGELSLPSKCDVGCEIEVPWGVPAVDTVTRVEVSVFVAYDGDAPDAAAAMSIAFGP